MQSLAILLTAISLRPSFPSSYTSSVTSVKKLVTWLQYMHESNDTAKRAYQIIRSIVVADNLVDPFVWKDVREVFVNESVQAQAQAPRTYQPWVGDEQPLQMLFEQQGGGGGGEFGYFSSGTV